MKHLRILLVACMAMAMAGCIVVRQRGPRRPAPRPVVVAKPAPAAAVVVAKPAPAAAVVVAKPPRGDRSAAPGRSGWELLGERKVAFRGDHDTVRVGRSEGRFRALRMTVEGSPMKVSRVLVTFGNGKTRELQVRHAFGEGSWTRRIDLPGKRRRIRRVDFWYRSVGRASGRATMRLFGQH